MLQRKLVIKMHIVFYFVYKQASKERIKKNERKVPASTNQQAVVGCNGPGVVQRKDRQKKEFHDQSDYR